MQEFNNKHQSKVELSWSADRLLLLGMISSMALAAWLSFWGVHGGVEFLTRPTSDLSPSVWSNLSLLGDLRLLLVFALLLSYRRPELLYTFLVAALIGWLLTRGIKLVVHAPRPGQFEELALLEKAHHISGSYSFPSGHTVSVMGFACLLIATTRSAWSWSLLIVAAACGYARVAIGAHWPVDVLGGTLVGLASAAIALHLFEKGDRVLKRIPQAAIVAACLMAIASLSLIDAGHPETHALRLAVTGLGIAGTSIVYGLPWVRRMPFAARLTLH